MRFTTRHLAVLAVALASPVLAGCFGDDQATKAGGTDGPVTLRIGTDDTEDKPTAPQIKEFARRVNKLSDGEIVIKPAWHAAGPGLDWDQRVARMVTGGELEMGLIPSRSWDTEGVTSLRAINAPFLITSDALTAEVVSADLADEMLSGLEDAGVVGLSLLPEGLRHPFGYEAPLLGPEDYRGQRIRTATSNTTAALFEAFGARPTDEEQGSERQAGMESNYTREPVGTATGNVAFYPKVNSLVVNADAFESLDEAQREILEQAASDTREWAIREMPTDAEAASAFCNRGSAIVHATDADVTALEEAAVPVYAQLERDEQTKRLIAAIRELKRDVKVSAAAPAPCGEADTIADPNAADKTATSQFNGIYRFELTDEQLRAAGVTDPSEIAQNHGVFTFTLGDGRYCWVQKAANELDNPDECSTYEIDGDRFVLNFPSGEPDVYRWSKTKDGDLEFIVLEAGPGELPFARAWTANTWKRIGDAE